MRLTLRKSRAEIAAERQRRYLEAWPIPQQMEAHAEAAAGRSARLTEMQTAFAAIKASLPYPPTEE
jgi:hypothetical protein